MIIFVDADSCPKRVREIICKAANRLRIPSFFVANRSVPILKNRFTHNIITDASDQAADLYIITTAKKGDLVITRDIPLAKQLVDLHIRVINDRGKVFIAENIGERLSIRNFMYDLQALGISPEKTTAFGKKEIMEFAQTLDKETALLLQAERMIQQQYKKCEQKPALPA